MVKTKTFLEGFNDLERLVETRNAILKARHKIGRVLVDKTSIGSLDDKSILTEEERTRFTNLENALRRAEDLVLDKILDQEKKCVEMNVIGFEPDEEVKPKDTEEDEYF